MGLNKNFNSFLKDVEDKIGIQIDYNTYDYEILKALYNSNESTTKCIEDLVNSVDVENKKGENLDDFFNFFNIYRISGNNSDIYKFKIAYNSKNEFSINKDKIIYFKGEKYKIIKDAYISSGINYIYTQKSYNLNSFENAIIVTTKNDNVFKINKSDINCNLPDKDIIENIQKNLKFISLEILSNEKESDIAFLERSKSILQQYGFSNNRKIENELLKDPRIKFVNFINQNGLTTIVIFPHIISDIKDILEYSGEVVKYFENSNLKVVAPNLCKLNINGLKLQIVNLVNYNKLISDISSEIKKYLSLNLLNDTIKRNEVIEIIKNIIPKEEVDLNCNKIKLEVSFYWCENYDEPIIIEDIEEEYKIENALYSLGGVN